MCSSKFCAILVLSFLSLVQSNDVIVGQHTPFAKKIYSAVKYANPAIWRRSDDVMISCPNHEVITAVYVTDLRSDKEGEAYIEAGGIGSKTVTIALKSPGILRGYKFSIEVYAQDVHSVLASGVLTTHPVAGLSGFGQYPQNPYNHVSYPTGSVYNNGYPG